MLVFKDSSSLAVNQTLTLILAGQAASTSCRINIWTGMHVADMGVCSQRIPAEQKLLCGPDHSCYFFLMAHRARRQHPDRRVKPKSTAEVQ